MAEAKVGQVSLKGVRGSFLRLFEPSASVAGGRESYKANFLIDPNTASGRAVIAQCHAAIKAVKEAQWKEKAAKIVIKDDRMCFRDGDSYVGEDSGEVYDGYEGMMVVSAANQTRPTVVDRDRSPLTKEDGKPYSGCYLNAIVRFYCVANKEKGGNGVFASLEGVQFVKDGPAFGSAPLSEDEFDDLGDDDGDDGIDEAPPAKKTVKKPVNKPADDDDDDMI